MICHKLPRAHKRRRQGHKGGGEKLSESIYLSSDLIVIILSNLPAKSLARFRCVSKLWSSLVNDTIKTGSLTQPRSLVIFKDSWLGKSCMHTYPLNTKLTTFLSSDKESYNNHKGSHVVDNNSVFRYVNGLLCCCSDYNMITIYNPTTNQSVLLPNIDYKDINFIDNVLFGYDPVENQYKVLCFVRKSKCTCKVLTLGDPKKLQDWRNIKHVDYHFGLVTSVCINGIIYYMRGYSSRELWKFDVRFERFDRIEIPRTLPRLDMELTLVNYQGKLGCVCHNDARAFLWIMEDGHDEKQEWSKIKLRISPPDILSCSLESWPFVITGVTRDGEIVIMPKTWSYAETLYAYFHDPKQNKTRRVGFETNMKGGLKNRLGISIFCVPDHIENIMPLLWD